MTRPEFGDSYDHYSRKGGHFKRGQFSRLQQELTKQTGTQSTKGVITELLVFDTKPSEKKRQKKL